MPSFYERYLAGSAQECEQIWDELYSLGAEVREPPYYGDAVDVARETMRRVRLNCEMLIPRLEHLGWRFGYEWAGTGNWALEEVARQPPLLGKPAPAAILNNIEANNGLLPISLRAFYEVVGAVNFVGTSFERPNWPDIEQGLDPLYVAGVEQAFGHTRHEWDESAHASRVIDYGDAFVPLYWGGVEITPDFLHKYFISGVGSDYIEIPALGADAPLTFEGGRLQIEGRDLTFVRSLRYALQGGGFHAFMPDGVWEARSAQEGSPMTRPDDDLAYLTQGLWPI